MELKHVLSKPRIRITLTRSDNDSNHSAYLNARIVRLDKIESKIKKMKRQSKSNVGHNPRIKILKSSILQATKNTRRNEATKVISFSKVRDKKLGNRKERKRRKYSKECNMIKNDLDLDTNESDYQILKNTDDQQVSKTCNSNFNQNYHHIKSEIVRDGSSHWIGSKDFNISQSNNKLTEIALFKILNKKSIFSKFLLNILPIKKLNPKNQPTFPSKYNKRKKNKKRRPRHKNSMERFIQKYILDKNPCDERDDEQINKYEQIVSTDSQAKSYKTKCVSTSPPSHTNLNLNDICESLSKRKSESYALNNKCDIGKTESEEIYLPLTCLINKAKHINKNSFDLIQSSLKKSNSTELTINYEKYLQKFEKTALLKRYHLISLSDLDMTSHKNHNFDGNCTKCDKILNDLLSSNQKLNSDENRKENVSNNNDKLSNKYNLSDCLPSIEISKHDKDRSKDKEKIKDLNISSNGYKSLNAQVGIPIVQQITSCFENVNRNSSTSVSDVGDHKNQKVSSSLEVNNSSNNSMIYTASIFDYETYNKSNRYMMVHCNDCDLICIVQPI